jgi:arabinose-5-phosphate isomerase
MTDAAGQRAIDAGIAAATEAVTHAVRAVSALQDRIPATRRAVELLLGAEGRVVVTGLGKSGLVGAKMAATMSSTGTLAFFVHAGDALHGEAGAVGPGDVVIAISNSGETDEVCHFARIIKDQGVALVAMTGCRGSSTLAALADTVVDVCVDREGDPYDLVPSSSTAATAVMGDAIAIALMVARGFGPQDFYRHHPAGSLGRRLGSR